MEKIYCPCCEGELVITHQDRYEDLGEHVSDPNGTPSMKNGYQCTYEYCIANNLNATWIEDGDIYISPPEGIKWTVAHDAIKKCSKSGMHYALNSWSHYYHVGKNAIEKRKRTFQIGKFKFDIYPKDKGYKYSVEKQYMPSLYKWKLDIYKQTDKYSYKHIIPTYRMVKFCINKFNMEYERWQKTGSKYAYNECYEEMMCLQYAGKKDERTYAKISAFLINLLYKHKCKELLKHEKHTSILS